MSVYISEDLRSIKTERALFDAMLSVLKRQCFKKITVKSICEEALISRAAFYAHFVDKYNLLSRWLTVLWGHLFDDKCSFEEIESMVNCHLSDITKVLRNLVYDIDEELFGIMFDLILSTKKSSLGKSEDDRNKITAKSNFYAGGILSYLLWQIRNKFPAEVPLMNRAFYDMICEFRDK